jgi:rare lipoprotein A
MNIENDLPPSGFVAAAFVAHNRFARAIAVSVIGLCVAQCMPETKLASVVPEVVTQTFNKSEPESLPKGVGYNKTGKPYTVAGKLYVPREEKGYSATGLASWYGTSFHGRETANGEVFDRNSISIAHPTMPLPSYVRVTNVLNGRSIIARVNDRGPFHGNRLVDVSEKVAIGLNFKHLGTARLKVDYIGRAPVSTDDTAMLLASLRTDGAPAQLGRAGSTVVMTSAKASSTQTQPALRIDTEEAADTVQQPTSQFVAGEAGLPLPPERPFAIGDAGFRPQFAALNSTKPTSNTKPAVETEQTEVAVPQAATVPLPPVRPGQFSAADASPLTEKSAAPAKTVSPVTVPTNGFVPVTAPAQRWNKGA